MSGVTIYMEGGGNSRDTKAALRIGMDSLLGALKQSANKRRLGWKLVCCGGRDETFRRFRNAMRTGSDGILVLLVDAEGPVEAKPRVHLEVREKGWNLTGVDDGSIHLMVQTMEAWILADVDALNHYYGQGFNTGAVPKAADLEGVAKRDLERSLRRATARTRKGRYRKIAHAGDRIRLPGRHR